MIQEEFTDNTEAEVTVQSIAVHSEPYITALSFYYGTQQPAHLLIPAPRNVSNADRVSALAPEETRDKAGDEVR